MIRKSFHYWLTALLLGPTCALALEIGEIQVNSALNQLFDARILLPALTPEELGKISVKLAGPPMFKEFGLDRTPALANLVFAIEYNAEGQVYVRVVSTQPIREPSLALLLEFGWPRGKTFREFTVFLDPVQRLVKRPGGRTKTVMETPASVVYGPESATAPPPPAPESNPSPPTALAAVPETATPPVEWAMPAGASAPLPPPEPVKAYQPGDSYRVSSGDGLWEIALKTRPDPGITRDQMMQALFRANPQAFSKVGINGLKIGATLRIPTLREIADWTGSPVAKRLAEKEPAPADTVKPDVKPAPVKSEPVAADGPEVFPLPAVATPLPEPVAAAPLPESVKPEPEVKPESEVARTAPEPVPASLPEPASEPVSVVAAAPEPAAESALPAASVPVTAATEPEPAVASAEEELSIQMLEPVSATPLLFLAIVEMMTTFAEIPAAIPIKMLSVTPPAVSEPAGVTTTDAEALPEVEAASPVAEAPPVIEPVNPVVETPPVIEPVNPVVETPLVIEMASPVAEMPPVIEPASPVAEAPLEPAAETPPVIELSSPVADMPPVIESASPVAEAPPPAIAEPVASMVYRGGDQYGPVSANEHLWSIATKVRLDPAIGKDAMMRALFMVNPQAFSKPGDMNSLKVGVMLRVPTLQEIAGLTGSKVARRLLESAPAPAAEPALPEPSGATSPDR